MCLSGLIIYFLLDKISSIFNIVNTKAKEYFRFGLTYNNIGLYNGQSSKIITSSLFYNLTRDPFYKNATDETVAGIFNSLNTGGNLKSISISNGFTGFLWSIDFLRSNGLTEFEVAQRNEIDSSILNRINKLDINYDLVSGEFNSIIYFLNNPEVFEDYIKDVVKRIYKKLSNSILTKFPSPMIDSSNHVKQVQYFGIAHGYSGLLILLAKIFEKNIETKICLQSIQLIFQILKKNYSLKNESLFPIYVSPSEKYYSKISGWCNGDLSAAYAISLTGSIMNDEEFVRFGKSVLDRILINEHLYFDKKMGDFFCHGKVGVSYLFLKLSILHGEKKFYDFAYQIFIDIDHKKIDPKSWLTENGSGLLLGFEGYLLACISFMEETNSSWDECLLLS